MMSTITSKVLLLVTSERKSRPSSSVQRRRLVALLAEVLALLGWARNLRDGQVLVDVVVQRQVALGDGVGAVGLVLVDKLMRVRSENVLGVLVHVLVVRGVAEDCCSAARAAADAHAREQLKGGDDRHREAPAADRLAAKPCPEETSEGGVDERDDAADAGQALHAREARASDTPCSSRCHRILIIALCRLCSGSGFTSTSSGGAAARDDPVQDDDTTQDTADGGVRRVRR